MKKIILILALSTLAFAQQWSGVLDPSRAVDWSNAGSSHINDARTLCVTAACNTVSGGSVTTANITAAINSMSSGQYLQIPAGTFTAAIITSKSNITIRGAGANSTFLSGSASSCNGFNALACAYGGDGNYWQSPNNTATWSGTNGVAGTYTQGATSIILSSVTSLVVGDPIILDQLDDQSDTGGLYVGCEYSDGSPVCYTGTAFSGPQRNSGALATIRGQQQMVNVTSISGTGPYTVVISPGIYAPNWKTSHTPQAWWASTPVFNIGIENMALNGDSNQGVMFYGCSGCWAKGLSLVRTTSTGTAYSMMNLFMSNHVTVRDSYFYGFTPDTYGIGTWISSDDLWENNIFHNVPAPMVCNSDCEGLVRAYNFSVNDHYSSSSNWLNQSSQTHSITLYTLDEGNIGSGAYFDSFHGNHSFNTEFRNRWDGNEPNNGTAVTSSTVPVRLNPGTRFNNMIANVLGTAGYHTGYKSTSGSAYFSCVADGTYQETATSNDPLTDSTSMFWGNWCVSGNNHWTTAEVPSGITNYSNAIPTSSCTSLLACPASFYLSAKPSYWSALKGWPSIGPELGGGNIGQCVGGTAAYVKSHCTASSQCSGGGTCTVVASGEANSNPAMDCYLTTMSGPANGTGSALTFDPAACYAAAPPVAPTVTTTTATNIGVTTATAGGTVTGASITSEGTCYGLSANPTSPCTSDGTVSPFVSSLTLLTGGTLYHYRAFATNSAGTSYGSDLTFTTLTCGSTTSPCPILSGNIELIGNLYVLGGGGGSSFGPPTYLGGTFTQASGTMSHSDFSAGGCDWTSFDTLQNCNTYGRLNTIIAPGDFGAQRVVMVANGSISCATNIWLTADDGLPNLWNTDDTAFILKTQGSHRCLFHFNPATLQATLSPLVLSASGSSWSWTNNSWLYQLGNTDGVTIQQQVVTLNSNPAMDSITTKPIKDLGADANCFGAAYTASWTSLLLPPAGPTDNVFTVGASTGGQGTGFLVVSYSTTTGQCTVINTQTGAVTQNGVALGTATCSNCTPTFPFFTHDVYQTHNPQYAIIVGTGGEIGYKIWNLSSPLTLTQCPGVTLNCDGHPAHGYLASIRGKSLNTTLYSDPTVQGSNFVSPPTYPNLHPSWNNNHSQTDTTTGAPYVMLKTSDVGTNSPGTGSAITNLLGTLPPFYDELWMNSADGQAVTPSNLQSRQLRTHNTGWSQFFDTQNAITVISQTGKYGLLASDWMCTLGNTTGSGATICGGPDWTKSTTWATGQKIFPQSNNDGNHVFQLNAPGGTTSSSAFSAPINVTSFTGTSGTLVFTTAANTFINGNTVRFTTFTAPNTGLNGQVVVMSAVDSTHFTATVTGSGYASGAGKASAWWCQTTGCTYTDGTIVWTEIGIQNAQVGVFVVEFH